MGVEFGRLPVRSFCRGPRTLNFLLTLTLSISTNDYLFNRQNPAVSTVNTKQTSCHMQPAGAAAQAGGDLAQYNAPYKRGSVSGLSLPCPATASILLSAHVCPRCQWQLKIHGVPSLGCLLVACPWTAVYAWPKRLLHSRPAQSLTQIPDDPPPPSLCV